MPFHSMNETCQEVNVSTETPMYMLVSGDLLRTLMQRTGTGGKITVRELAQRGGISVGAVSSLLTGAQQHLPADKAERIASTIGVDVLVLFIPCQRAGRTYVSTEPTAVAV